MPFPNPDTTPPVTNTYFTGIALIPFYINGWKNHVFCNHIGVLYNAQMSKIYYFL